MNTMSKIQPMDLPELRMMVARHLSPHDLKACTLVCKAWHTTFQPAVWSTISISERRSVARCQLATKEGFNVVLCANIDWSRSFASNGHYIRRLELNATEEHRIFQECFQLAVDKCISLTALSFDSSSKVHWDFERQESIQNLVQAMIDQNPGIQNLSTNKVYCLQKAFVLSGLRSLSISVGLSTQDVVCLLTTFPLLEELILSETLSTSSKLVDNEQQHPITDDSTAKQKPSALKRLSICGMNSPAELTTVLERCPKLQFIYFQSMRKAQDEATNILSPDFLSDPSLVFRSSDPSAIQQVLRVLAYQQIFTLTLNTNSADAFQAIAETHSLRLQHLVVSCCYVVPQTVLIILVECVGLKTLRVVDNGVEPMPSILPSDRPITKQRFCMPLDLCELIVRPWVCVDLEELEIPVALHRHSMVPLHDQVELAKMTTTPDDSDVAGSCTKLGMSEWQKAERLFMKRLAALTQLRRLTLPGGGRVWSGSKTSTQMAWRVPTGLEQLKNLKCLEVLDLSDREYVQGIREFRWMKANWTSLAKLVVDRIKSEQKRAWLRTWWPELNVVEIGR